MTTQQHRFVLGERVSEPAVLPESVHLVVTSPPYPMVEMWDASFSAQQPAVGKALSAVDGSGAFEAMHSILDAVWADCHRAVVPGGLVCVNVGDATRKLGNDFQLFSNHARTIQGLLSAGFQLLPDIVWRKPTNAPNKFMGSGMLPGGAYVTYEHEYIIIARKGGRRVFRTAADKARRRRSAYFWEERNLWFSDVWQGLTGVRQAMKGTKRSRSGAFPFALPARLIDMYSLQDDLVMDPFAGTGTTALAAAAAGRHSVSVEADVSMQPVFERTLSRVCAVSSGRTRQRLDAHRAFVAARVDSGKAVKHVSQTYGFSVMSRQEVEIALPVATKISRLDQNRWKVDAKIGI